MGQYHTIYNITKKEYLSPHSFGHGARLLEWGCSGPGINTALAVLLCNSNGRGGGDLNTYKKNVPYKDARVTAVAGRWAGDRIVVQGDYAKAGDPGFLSKAKLKDFKNVSDEVKDALCADEFLNKRLSTRYDFESERAEQIEQLKEHGYKIIPPGGTK